MKSVIFLGPTLSVTDAERILPGAVYRPPAQQSDILSCVLNEKPDVIGLIDGLFDQSLSVWHKEILFALSKGVKVYGAASMGALRASETSDFGMIGIGKIYEMFEKGDLTDDDEVAVVHSMSDSEYQSLSLPMINIRMTLGKALRSAVIDEDAYKQLIDIAKSLYFPERNWPNIFNEAVEAGADKEWGEVVKEFCESNYTDLKQEDAVKLLEVIQQLNESDLKTKVSTDFKWNHMFESMYYSDRKIEHNGEEIALSCLTNYCAVHMKEYNQLNFNSLNRQLVMILGELMKVELSDEELNRERERFTLVRGLYKESDVEEWMKNNDFTDEEFMNLIKELATCRKLHRYILARNTYRGNRKYILDELRIQGKYQEWFEKTVAQEKILTDNNVNHFEDGFNVNMADLVIEHMQETDWNIDSHYKVWGCDSGFPDVDSLKFELLKARRKRTIMKEKLSKLLDL